MIKTKFFSILISCFSIACCIGQQQSEPLEWLNAHATPFDSGNTGGEMYLPLLAKELKGNVICGLGEATHGTYEFSQEKSRIVQYLVKHEGYRVLGFEFGYSAIAPINNYLLGGKGDLKKLMQPLHLFKTKEIYNLFQELRVYNETRPLKDKVSLFGFDTNYIKSDIDASALYCADYMGKNMQYSVNSKGVVAVFKKIASPNLNYLYELSEEDVAIVTALYQEVKTMGGKGADFALFKKHLSLLYQGTLLGDPLARDNFMAENINEFQKENKLKTIIWGHNVHLAKDTTMAQCRGMGYHLKQNYRDAYYALIFDTFKGSVNVLSGEDFEKHSFETSESSLSAVFARAKYPAFFMSLKNSDGNPFYNVSADVTNIFANWNNRRTLPMRPGIDFDGLIFIKETTASETLE